MSKFIKPINISLYKSDSDKMKNSDEKYIKNLTNKLNGHEDKIDKTTRELETLLKNREIQKTNMKQSNKFKLISSDILRNTTQSCDDSRVFCCKNESICLPKKCCYSHVWDAYWPLMGRCGEDPHLEISVDYVTFNGCLIQKWRTILPTPSTCCFPIKDLFVLKLKTNHCIFDFDIKFENLPNNCEETIINVNQRSCQYPFNLNQYLLIKDPNICSDDCSTNINAIIYYYQTNEIYFNQFTKMFDSFGTIKNLFLSTQLFMIHINQIKNDVELSISYNTTIGENLFKVDIETSHRVEIKETLIPVAYDQESIKQCELMILQRSVYIDGSYFMTYATYINDVIMANNPELIPNINQAPIQLATMLLTGAVTPTVDFETYVPITEQERILAKIFREILKK